MSSVKFSALLMGAALFVGMGATTLSADMKCGAGKCGSSAQKQKKYMDRDSGKCGAQNKGTMRDGDMPNKGKMRNDGKCGDAKKGMMNGEGKMRNDGKCGANN